MRKMRSNELADRMGITTANLSILKPASKGDSVLDFTTDL
jgi:DNA-binding Xre family transcriptional regulator